MSVVERVEEQSDFDRIANNMIHKLNLDEKIDYDFYKNELMKLQKPLSNIFNPEDLANDLARVQAYKDRAVEIVGILTRNYLTYKRLVEVLTKGWPKFSNEKSAEKREGEALLKMSGFIMDANDADIAYRYAMDIMRNLESQMDSVSRQITCAQAAAQISGSRYAFDAHANSNERFTSVEQESEVVQKPFQKSCRDEEVTFDNFEGN